jgi:hypothetical protein
MFASSVFQASNFIVQWFAGFAMVLGLLWAILKWFHNFLTKSVSERLSSELVEIKKQTVPNGGGSLRDAIDRIERKMEQLEKKMDQVDLDLTRHLGFHDGQKAL